MKVPLQSVPDGADSERRQPASAADEWLEAAVQRPSEDAHRRRMIPQFAVRYSS